ncbi:hypothetical protein CASFOL_008283 [Castilleja foliolosa]|uniref:SHSP domain-containing protein n=1 Tax=Castilleja foliolosa TaxID=1961234 RepID=A0ABD3DYI8_9LAMI
MPMQYFQLIFHRSTDIYFPLSQKLRLRVLGSLMFTIDIELSKKKKMSLRRSRSESEIIDHRTDNGDYGLVMKSNNEDKTFARPVKVSLFGPRVGIFSGPDENKAHTLDMEKTGSKCEDVMTNTLNELRFEKLEASKTKIKKNMKIMNQQLVEIAATLSQLSADIMAIGSLRSQQAMDVTFALANCLQSTRSFPSLNVAPLSSPRMKNVALLSSPRVVKPFLTMSPRRSMTLRDSSSISSTKNVAAADDDFDSKDSSEVDVYVWFVKPMGRLDFESSSGKEQKWEGKQIADGLQIMMDIPRHNEGVKIMVEKNKLIIEVKSKKRGWFLRPLGTSDFESSPESLHLLISPMISKNCMWCGKPLGVIGGCEINRCNDLPFFDTLREAVIILSELSLTLN